LIILWQIHLYNHAGVDQEKGLQSASGVHDQVLFSYGLYYWGLFPVFPDRALLPDAFHSDDLFYSQEGADQILNEHADSLKMESRHTMLYGELGKNYLPYFHALLKGSPKDVSFRPANASYHILALVFLFVVFWINNRGLLGLVLVVFLGSYQFQIYEIYQNENVFGYYITTCIWMAALFLPFILDIKFKTWVQFILCLLGGVIFATLFTIRSEPLSISLGVVFAILTYQHARIFRKAALLIVLLLAFIGGELFYSAYFEHQFNKTVSDVEERGGHVFSGRRAKHHVFWHNMWIGLADYDRKYGITWQDSRGLGYARGILRKKYGRKVLKEFGVKDGYENPIFLHPEYSGIIKDKFFQDIKNDPVWYVTILAKRAWRIVKDSFLADVTILGIRFPSFLFFVWGVLALVFLVIGKNWALLKLWAFSFPTAVIPFLVYSEGGMTHYFIGHLFLAAIALFWMIRSIIFLLYNKGTTVKSLRSEKG